MINEGVTGPFDIKFLAAPDQFSDFDNVAYVCRNLNLHIDIDSGQCAVKLVCCECGDFVTYWCYDSVETALWATSEREEQLCQECWEKEYGDSIDEYEDGDFDEPAGYLCSLGGGK
jgi:hypothetical protein